MSCAWKRYFERVLQKGEMFGLVFATLMLIVVEGCFVYCLHHIQLPDRPLAASGFLVIPPWYRKPRFEVTLLLTIAAGMLFSVCRGLWNAWRERNQGDAAEIVMSLRRRVSAAAAVAARAIIALEPSQIERPGSPSMTCWRSKGRSPGFQSDAVWTTR